MWLRAEPDDVAEQAGVGLSATKGLATLVSTLNMQVVDLSQCEVDLEVLRSFPVKLIHRYMFFRWAKPTTACCL